MSQVHITSPLLVLFLVRLANGFPGDTVMLLPPFEVRTMDQYPGVSSQPYIPQFETTRQKTQQVLHTNKRPPQVPMMEQQSNRNISFAEFMDSLNKVSQQRGEQFQQPLRAFQRSSSIPAATSVPPSLHPREEEREIPAGRDGNPSYPSLPPISFPRPNFASPATYHETPSALTPSSVQPKVPVLKPDFSSLLTPVAGKSSGKSSLISLIFSLLSGSSGGLQLTGLKDVLIEGIIRPILVAKGGIKALISKLSIPVISLLLINLEVLITVWWLWEECPAKLEPVPLPPPTPALVPYPSKPAYNYNNHSYR